MIINGSIGTVLNIQSHSKDGSASGTVYMKFQDKKAGNKYKVVCLGGVLKQYVAITVKTKSFHLAKKDNISVKREQFPSVTAHAFAQTEPPLI